MRPLSLAIALSTSCFLGACGSGGGGGGGGSSNPAATSDSLTFETEALDLDGDTHVDALPGSPGSFPSSTWDFYFAHNGARPVHAVLFHRGGGAVAIAHLPGRTFDSVTYADVAGATFTTSLVDVAFDSTLVVLVQTDLGDVYKVGNASEDATTVDFDYALLTPP